MYSFFFLNFSQIQKEYKMPRNQLALVVRNEYGMLDKGKRMCFAVILFAYVILISLDNEDF